MKSILNKIVGASAAVALLLVPSVAFALAPFSFEGVRGNGSGDDTVGFSLTPISYQEGVEYFVTFEGRGDNTGIYKWTALGGGLGDVYGSGQIAVTPNSIETTDGHLSDTITYLKNNLGSATSSLSSLTTIVAGLTGGSPSFNVAAFMANQASTTAYIASSTSNGFMSPTMVDKLTNLSTSTATTGANGLMSSVDKSKLDGMSTSTATTGANGLMSSADKTKLDGLSATAARVFATSTRSFTTSTGATGFQISSTRDVHVSYGIKVSATATIGTPSEGHVVLEISPTNSATASSWYQVGGECGTGQNITLAALLSSVQTAYCTVTAMVPAGYYAKLRTITVTDTPVYTFLSGQEVQL